MPIPTAATWNVGDNPTSTILNTRIRDAITGLTTLPMAVLRKTATQAIASSTYLALTWPTEDLDTDGGHSTVTNTERYTAQVTGWYHLTATVVFSGNATGRRDAFFRINGITTRRYGWHTSTPGPNAGGADICIVLATHAYLTVGDYAEVIAYQDSGGSLNLLASNQDSRFEIMWVSL
jgi:hypothetical protein